MAHLRYKCRAVPLNLKLEPNIDYAQVNALMYRDIEARTGMVDYLWSISEVRERKERLPDKGWATHTLVRDAEQELPATQSRKPKK